MGVAHIWKSSVLAVFFSCRFFLHCIHLAKKQPCDASKIAKHRTLPSPAFPSFGSPSVGVAAGLAMATALQGAGGGGADGAVHRPPRAPKCWGGGPPDEPPGQVALSRPAGEVNYATQTVCACVTVVGQRNRCDPYEARLFSCPTPKGKQQASSASPRSLWNACRIPRPCPGKRASTPQASTLHKGTMSPPTHGISPVHKYSGVHVCQPLGV